MATIPLRYPAEFPVFCVGGSAGAVEVMLQLGQELPADFPAPVLFVLHRRNPPATEARFLLPQLLQDSARLEVVSPEDGTLVRAGRLYVMPHGLHAVVEDNQVRLREQPADCLWRPSIDVLFKSIARQYRERTVAVLLSGLLDDGVDGLRETTREGGLTVAQSPDDADSPDLPLNAILKDHPTYVLPVQDMAKLFCELCRFPYFPDQERVLQRAAITAYVDKSALQDT